MGFFNGEILGGATTIVCLTVSSAFLCLYALYDRVPVAKRIAHFVHVISPGPARREGILFWAFQPMAVLLFGLLFR